MAISMAPLFRNLINDDGKIFMVRMDERVLREFNNYYMIKLGKMDVVMKAKS